MQLNEGNFVPVNFINKNKDNYLSVTINFWIQYNKIYWFIVNVVYNYGGCQKKALKITKMHLGSLKTGTCRRIFLHIPTVAKEMQKFAQEHEDRFDQHINDENLHLVDNHDVMRILKHVKKTVELVQNEFRKIF